MEAQQKGGAERRFSGTYPPDVVFVFAGRVHCEGINGFSNQLRFGTFF